MVCSWDGGRRKEGEVEGSGGLNEVEKESFSGDVGHCTGTPPRGSPVATIPAGLSSFLV